MNEVKNFYGNNTLEIVFMLGIISMFAVYWFCMTGSFSPWGKFFCSAGAFVGEFLWLMLLCYFAKTLDTFAKFLVLNLLAVICLVVICSYLSYSYVPHWQMVIFTASVGLISFLFSIVVFTAIIKAKGL